MRLWGVSEELGAGMAKTQKEKYLQTVADLEYNYKELGTLVGDTFKVMKASGV